MIPGRSLVLWSILPLFLGFVTLFFSAAVWPMLAVDLALVLVAVLDAFLGTGFPSVRREVALVQAVGRSFPVQLVVSNPGRFALNIRLVDDAPGSGPMAPQSLVLGSQESEVVTYDLSVHERGRFEFGPVTVRTRSWLGFWERQRRIPVEGLIRVYPDFRELQSNALQARLSAQQAPVRARRRPGGENEFENLRPYVNGDPYKHIDWKATARRNSYISRQYGQEVNQTVIFLLDSGRLMTGRSGNLSLFDHGLNAALLMGQAALNHGDRVGVLVFDREIRTWIPPRGGVRTGGRLIRGLYDVFPAQHEPDFNLAYRFLGQHVKQRSLVVLLTAIVDEASQELVQMMVQGLAGRHLPLAVWMRDAEVDGLLTQPSSSSNDVYQRCAAAELLMWREQSLAALRKRGALVLDTTPDKLTGGLLSKYLEIKARRLL